VTPADEAVTVRCCHCQKELANDHPHTTVCETCRDWIHFACAAKHRALHAAEKAVES
jgi:hypothetical protein